LEERAQVDAQKLQQSAQEAGAAIGEFNKGIKTIPEA